MPVQTTEGKIASEQEVIDFANKVREAGGGDLIEALMPSYPSDPNTCLIANALNFECKINGWRAANVEAEEILDRDILPYKAVDGFLWSMSVETDDLAEKIAAALDLPYIDNGRVILPGEIASVATKFDDYSNNKTDLLDIASELRYIAEYDTFRETE